MTEYVIYLMSWKLNSKGLTCLLFSHDYCTKPGLPSPSTARCLHNASFGRQSAMLPDLPVLDHEQPTETSDHSREQ
eukprot:4007698-Pyramimonas_sp.AAC.1